MTSHTPTRHVTHPAWGIAVFALIAIVGLFYVKWSPYYDRAFVAAETHSIGSSILTGAQPTPPAPSFKAALDYAVAYGLAIWKAMVLGLLLGSAVQALLPRRWILKVLGGTGLGSVVAGGLLSLPGMMCTCCAAPVVAGLRKCQAAPGSTVAFWLGNTVLNPATLIFMGFVLGWHWMGLRLALGIVMVFGLGWLINRLSRGRIQTIDSTQMKALQAAGMADLDEPHAFKRWMRALTRMTVRLLPEYLVLVLLLGAARAWLFPEVGAGVDNSLLWILGLALAGALFVIPTAGEVPIVQAMLSLGMAAGPAAALIMTLPPISLPSLAMVVKSFRPSELAILTAGVVAIGVLAGGLAIVLGF
ncbi:MAG: permease [Pigmentiphaga sp.]|uniref:permease n=1 Tax=Pigmentiphaga sp. TaxID=1977564 RepID=UPI0029AAAFC1|nr:permease [Pigmentiphaga sp.]MDX3908086.1 permease [Pigmentiphaga sp.]